MSTLISNHVIDHPHTLEWTSPNIPLFCLFPVIAQANHLESSGLLSFSKTPLVIQKHISIDYQNLTIFTITYTIRVLAQNNIITVLDFGIAVTLVPCFHLVFLHTASKMILLKQVRSALVIPFPVIYLEELEVGSQRDTRILMFIAASFTVDIGRSLLSKYPLMDEWIYKIWYILTKKYNSALKRKGILTYATTQMNLEHISLNEISQSQKHKYCVITLLWGI